MSDVRHAVRARPRLLIVVDIYPDGGGISAIVENIAAALRDEYELHLAIVDRRAGWRDQLPLPEERVHSLDSGIRKLVWPQLFPTSLVYPLWVGRFLRSLVGRLEPDAVIVQDGLFLPVPGLLAVRGRGIPLAVMDHGTTTNSLDPTWQRFFPRQLPFPKNVVFRAGFALDRPWRALRWRLGFRYADEVWYVGYELKPFVDRAGGRGRRYAQIVPGDFTPATPEQRAAARDELGIPADAVVVNVVSRFAGEKGWPEIMEALSAVRKESESLVVPIAGDGPLEGWLREQVRERGLPVRFMGRLDRAGVARLHHASDFHLYAGTISCGMTIGLLEAMAAGVVPIASDVPYEQVELIQDAGWVFSAGDASALARALSEALATSPEERARLSARAIERVNAYRTPRFEDLVARIVAQATPATPAT